MQFLKPPPEPNPELEAIIEKAKREIAEIFAANPKRRRAVRDEESN